MVVLQSAIRMRDFFSNRSVSVDNAGPPCSGYRSCGPGWISSDALDTFKLELIAVTGNVKRNRERAGKGVIRRLRER